MPSSVSAGGLVPQPQSVGTAGVADAAGVAAATGVDERDVVAADVALHRIVGFAVGRRARREVEIGEVAVRQFRAGLGALAPRRRR